MSIKSLQSLAIKNINVAQIMKAECAEKEVISRVFLESMAEKNLASESFGSLSSSDLFWRALEAAGNHPCELKEFRVWHGNWKLTRNGDRIERKPLKYRNRSTCRCKCERRGRLCECRCAAIIKMVAEFRMRSCYFDRKQPLEKFRLNPETKVDELLQEFGYASM